MRGHRWTAARLGCAAVVWLGVRAGALEPGPGVVLRRSQPAVDAATRVYLPFDQVQDGRSPNLRDTGSSAALRDAVLVPGLFGQALGAGTGGVAIVEGKALAGVARFSLTVEFWLRCGATPWPGTLLEAHDTNGVTAWTLDLVPSMKGAIPRWSVSRADGGRSVLTATRGFTGTGDWHRVALLHGALPGQGGGKGYRIYIDGYLAAEEPDHAAPVDSSMLLIRTPPEGALDELAISSAARDLYPDVADTPMPPRNLDFEQQAAGWVGVYDACRIDTGVSHGGKASLRLETDDLYTREYLSPLFSVATGTTYRISFWAKVDRFDAGYASLGVWVRWYFEPEETCSLGGDLVAHCVTGTEPRTFDWRRLTADIKVPEQGTLYRQPIRWARLQVKNDRSRVTAWVDDIVIEPVTSGSQQP